MKVKMKKTKTNSILDYIVLVFKWIFKIIYIIIKYIFKIIFFIFELIFALLLLGNNKSDNKTYNTSFDKNTTKKKDNKDELDDYPLEDYQKELVKKGEYEPWSFEENEELEEDDYHYEDE